MKLHSYPKVHALGHPAITDLLKDDVVVQEKVDGSQISFALIDEELHIRSKNAEVFGDNPNDMFAKAVEVIYSLRDRMEPGYIYRGEYLRAPKHNALEYGRHPKNHIVLFDVETGPSAFLPYVQVCNEAAELGLEVIPLVYSGKAQDAAQLHDWMKTESFLGGPLEGLVVKNYERFGRDGKVLMGKHVSEQFKETNKENWKKQNPSKNDVIQVLIAKYNNEQRWEKAVQHLREAGELEHSPKDIGALMKAVQQDIAEECEDEIKQALWNHAKGHILRGAAKGLPEWYKQKLAASQFDSEAA